MSNNVKPTFQKKEFKETLIKLAAEYDSYVSKQKQSASDNKSSNTSNQSRPPIHSVSESRWWEGGWTD